MRTRPVLDRLFAIDYRSLAAFRIGIGALVLVDLWTRSSALEQHYTDIGVLPREACARLLSVSGWQWSVHFVTGSVAGQSALFVLAAVAAVALVVGFRTRAATILTWGLLVSLQVRNPMVLYGADQLLRLMLFWGMFVPLAAVWSVDSRGARPAGSRHLTTASAALLLQLCVMYFFAGLLKQNASWHSGDALGYALSSEMYVTAFGRVVAGWPSLVSSLGRAVPWIELFAPVMLLMPSRTEAVRKIGLPLLAAFHVGMGLALRTGLFQPVVLVALIPFLPSGFWSRVGIGSRADSASVDASQAASPIGAWRSVVTQFVVASLFAYVVAWNVVGLRVHEYSAQQGLAWMQQWWREGHTGVPMSFRDYAVERRMGVFGWIGRGTALYQRWDMFETAGREIRGWPAITGTLADGSGVDLSGAPYAEGAKLDPTALPAFYPGTRWLVYFTYLRTSGTQAARELLPAVVTRDWERRNAGRRLEALRIVFVQEVDAPGGSPAAKVETWYDGPANGRNRDGSRSGQLGSTS